MMEIDEDNVVDKKITDYMPKITDYTKQRLVPSNLDKHLQAVLDVVLKHSGESAFSVVCALREKFKVCTGSAYNLIRKLSEVGMITYVPREPIQFIKLFTVPSRYTVIDVDRVRKLPQTLVGLAWAKNIKVKMVYPGVVRWIYEGKRRDGKKPPVFFILKDGIYENPAMNLHLDAPQRRGIAERAVFGILRQHKCLII